MRERWRESERPLCRHTTDSRHTADMERQRKQNRGFIMGEKLLEGSGRRERKDRTGETAQLLLPGSPGMGQRSGAGVPAGRPVQGAAWGKLGGRIVISVGVLLNYTTSYLSPGGAAGGQTDDGRTDGGREGGEGREDPSRDGEPPTRTHRLELVCGEGPARSVLRVGARTQESGPPAPSSPGNPGISPLAPSSAGTQEFRPLAPSSSKVPGVQGQ